MPHSGANPSFESNELRLAELGRQLEPLEGEAADELRTVIEHLIRRSVLDRRRRRLGLRHRLRRSRPRARERPQRQRTGVGHRGLLQHRRSDVEGHAAWAPWRSSPPAASGVRPKDLALQAISYGDVYVARVAMGADPQQTLTAFREAEAYEGPSLIIAYSHCIAHGYDMRSGLDQHYRAVASGHWPLIRYDPMAREAGENPFLLDSPRPRMRLADYRKGELRFRALRNVDPAQADRQLALARRLSTCAGTPTRRWRAKEPQDSPESPLGSSLLTMAVLPSDRPGYPLHGSRTPKPAGRFALPALLYARRHPSPGRLRRRARSSCTRSSRSSWREQVAKVARLVEGPAESFPEALDYVPQIVEEDPGNRYLSLLEQAAGTVEVPLIASLNGVSAEGWTDHARDMQEAGAAAIELNIYSCRAARVHRDPTSSSRHFDVLHQVKDAVDVPVAIKLSPYFSSFASFALRLDAAGADALVLFNRFLQPDVDPEALAVERQRHALKPRRGPTPPDLDRAPARAAPCLAGGHRRCARASRRSALPAGRSGRGHEHLRTAATRRRLRAEAARRPRGLDGAPRVPERATRVRGLLAVPAEENRGRLRTQRLREGHAGRQRDFTRGLVNACTSRAAARAGTCGCCHVPGRGPGGIECEHDRGPLDRARRLRLPVRRAAPPGLHGRRPHGARSARSSTTRSRAA